jgi:hypothetical protein
MLAMIVLIDTNILMPSFTSDSTFSGHLPGFEIKMLIR